MALRSPRFADNARLQAASENSPPMRPGETGEAVAILQQALVDLGFKMPVSFAKGGPDGVYGGETERTVRQFQAAQGFPLSGQDGRAGHDTLGRLDQLFAGPDRAAHFEEVFPSSGFDGSSRPPWLMVPLGQFASVRLVNGDDLTLVNDDPGIAQAERGLAPHRVAVLGRSVGTTTVRAARGRKTVAELQVTVKQRRVVTVAFYVVTDKNNISPAFSNRNDHVPNRDRFADIDDLLRAVNGIYLPQTNVQFAEVKRKALDIARDLDPVVLPDHEPVFQTRADASAMYHVFFVRQVQSVEVGDAALNGVTKIGNVWSVVGNAGDAVTVAHEAGHSRALGGIGRNSDPAARDQLMFCSRRRTGTKIRRAQADRMNPSGAAAGP